MTTNDQNFLHKSVVVAAHPDDEVLWFSSVLSDVDDIVICFADVPGNAQWSKGRKKSLSEYPLKNLTCLNLTEADVFWSVDWVSPVTTEYGLAIAAPGASEARYRSNFDQLFNALRDLLADSSNVFSHNPWGEYGNAEHVQVFRVLRRLQAELDFHLWVPAYVSNKSSPQMIASVQMLTKDHENRQTDKALAHNVADLYKRNECWTWYDDYQWPESETFYKVSRGSARKPDFGSTLQLQYIQVEDARKSEPRPGFFARIRGKLKRILGKPDRSGNSG